MVPSEKPALCFSGEVDNAQTITVLGVLYVLAVAPSLWGVGGAHEEGTLFISFDQRSCI